MSVRSASLVASLTLFVVAGCAAAIGSPTPGAGSPAPAAPASPVAASATLPTPVPTVGVGASPSPSANAGDVKDPGSGPQLTVQQPRAGVIDVLLEDPDAKAWRLVIGGVGEQADDRVEIAVEVGDVTPVITTTEVVQGQVADRVDMSGYIDETAITGTCHRTLGVCIDSSAFRFSEDGTGGLLVRLQMPDGQPRRLMVTGATAGWPGEPFILGPWTTTEPFAWDAV